jgi:flagellar hook protein FlgE
MMRSLYSGVSSLKAHQLKMDVIGNNIANVNTVGFKASSVSFAEMYSQTLQGASSSNASRGGTNPMQVGLGTTLASIAVNHSKGSIQRTDIATDLMIDGDGFFMVTDDANAQNVYYTRAGNFSLDELGYLVTSSGMKVLDKNNKPIQINMSDTKTATETDQLTINGNLNFNESDYTTTVDVYDSLGDVHTVNFNFVGDPLTTGTELDLTGGGVDPTFDPLNDPTVAAHNYSYRQVTITDPETGTQIVPDLTTTPPQVPLFAMFNEQGEIVDLVNLADPTNGSSLPTHATGTLTMNIPGASDLVLTIDRNMFFANGDSTSNDAVRIFTQYSKESDAKGVQLNGISAGTISSFNISTTGEVVGIYTNGEQKVLRQIGLASFDNPPGLMKLGGNLFQDTPNSGVATYGTAGAGSFGTITPGALEMSNVDLSEQFTAMITTQRGFQANSRVITTSDEILQELVNLKR